MLQQVIEAVRQVAHDEVMPRYLKVARERKSDGSLFTQADIAAQHALARRLQEIHPYPVLGEEMTEAEQLASWEKESEAIWCIDPIDGTTNFANGLPYFAVSVALLKGGSPVLGVTFDPTEEEAFYAEKGKGAFLNGVELPIHDDPRAMRECVAQVDLKRLPENLSSALGRRPPYSSQRNFGVAAGRFHLYLHGGQKLWDYAAGSLILEEAGGHMCSLTHEDFWSEPAWTKSVIAALDPALFAQWKSWIRERL
jgi:myo-inositol-1(or 4)-monophosphatase